MRTRSALALSVAGILVTGSAALAVNTQTLNNSPGGSTGNANQFLLPPGSAASPATSPAPDTSPSPSPTSTASATPDDNRAATPSPSPTSSAAPSPSDDPDEPGDDNGGIRETPEPGDDHGGHGTSEPGDDHGGHGSDD
jgi:hypothetical protein